MSNQNTWREVEQNKPRHGSKANKNSDEIKNTAPIIFDIPFEAQKIDSHIVVKMDGSILNRGLVSNPDSV
jgi:hypothetical protein